MGVGSFIAESPVKFLAVLGAGALLVTGFVVGNPVPKATNPWALDPSLQRHKDPLAKLKDAANEVGGRFGIDFGEPEQVIAEPVPPPVTPSPRKPHRPRH